MLKLFNRLFASSDAVLSAPGVSERFAQMLTDKNNPDHILLAYILRSFATEFDQWTVSSAASTIGLNECLRVLQRKFTKLPVVNSRKKRSQCYDQYNCYKLVKDGVNVVLGFEIHRWDNLEIVNIAPVLFTINDTPFNLESALKVYASYLDLFQKQQAIKAAAAKAKAEMEANEKKWNLVENVLGLKRLEDGTLVAKQPAE